MNANKMTSLEKLKAYLDQKPRGNDPDCVIGWMEKAGYVEVTIADLRRIVEYAEARQNP